ncbi:hypothetical protein UFOVP193_52 [uncultured Caudovirales phage]|uniref:Uncharacterized protein n=1 Tax=uncultured Caudovirales phage TaxID=2100421 RepID=A0A6J7WG05_9CAUD|nr:hypothetical protein UFOVP193_52 [uncultured Caudovirales phage]
MLKSKHSGWTWELKRTPFGGGGGGFISAITDPISSALGTDGGGGGILGGLASIDPGPAIGQGLAEVDKTVNRELPGGWTLPAIITAAVVAPELAPLLAEEGAAAGIEAGVGQDAFWQAIASGSTGSEATGMGLAAQNAGVALSPEMIAYANASADPIGSINAIAGLTPEEFASYTQIIGGPTQAAGLTAGEDLAQLMASHPNLTAAQLEDIMAINYGTDPMLSADAANLAAQGYDANTINQVLGYSYNPTELAGTGIDAVAADSAAGLNAKDVLQNLSRAKQLANLLGSAGSAIKAAKMPTQQQWQKQSGINAVQATPEQFGGLYEMNKSPFTFQNPMASALAGGKQPGVYDVSGVQGTTLNTDQQNKIYSSLLRS